MTQAGYGTQARPSAPQESRRTANPQRRLEIERANSLAKSSAVAALRSVMGGLVIVEVIVIVLWAGEAQSGSTASQAARAGVIAWEWAHHAFIHVAGGTVSFTPPAFLLLPLWLVRRSARRLHPDPEAIGTGWAAGIRATLLLALPYAAIAAAVSMLAKTQGIEAEALSSSIAPLLAALVGAGSWCCRPAVDATLLGPRTALRPALAAGRLGLAVLMSAGAIATTVSLLWHFSLAAELSGAITTSALGSLGLLVLGIAVLPAAFTWAAAVAAGPGFALGAHTAVTAGTVHLGGVPALAVMAALPQSGSAAWGLRVLPVAMVLAGMLTGANLHRRLSRSPLANRCGWAFVAAASTGLSMALLCVLSSGSVAPGRLETVGPSAWRVGLAVTEELGLIATAVVLLLHWRSRRARVEA